MHIFLPRAPEQDTPDALDDTQLFLAVVRQPARLTTEEFLRLSALYQHAQRAFAKDPKSLLIEDADYVLVKKQLETYIAQLSATVSIVASPYFLAFVQHLMALPVPDALDESTGSV